MIHGNIPESRPYVNKHFALNEYNRENEVLKREKCFLITQID